MSQRIPLLNVTWKCMFFIVLFVFLTLLFISKLLKMGYVDASLLPYALGMIFAASMSVLEAIE